MQPSWVEVAMGYVLLGSLLVGLPVIFFLITFLPGWMRTTGEFTAGQIIGSEDSEHPPHQASPAGPPIRSGSRALPAQRKGSAPRKAPAQSKARAQSGA